MRDLGRVRGDGRGRARAPGRAARAGSLPRRSPDRAELPRDRRLKRPAERDVRSPGIPAGNIGFSSQSGALGLAFLQEATARGLGLSAFVSIGNKADISSNDLLDAPVAADAPLPEGAAELLERRAAARAAQDFAASDALRDELAALGVEVRDTPDGQQTTVDG